MVWFTVTLLRVYLTWKPLLWVPWTKCNHSLPPIWLLLWTTAAFIRTLQSWSLLNQGVPYTIQILYTMAKIPFIHIGVCATSSYHHILQISTQLNFSSQQWSITLILLQCKHHGRWVLIMADGTIVDVVEGLCSELQLQKCVFGNCSLIIILLLMPWQKGSMLFMSHSQPWDWNELSPSAWASVFCYLPISKGNYLLLLASNLTQTLPHTDY